MPDDNRLQFDTGRPAAGPRIAILGAGFSGLGMAIRLRQEGFENFTIYEKAADVGGTWRENVYPGVACDVPSHLYSFSFEPNPRWSRRYSPGGEIWEYMRHCARKYDLYRSIEFGRTVTAIRHDGRCWHVQFADGSETEADFVISGLGGLHVPKYPEIDGLETFRGPVFHTAQWRSDVDLDGKRVAVIGSAASAIQVIPEIAPRVARLDVYQRTANWIMARMSYAYPRWLQRLFAKVPLLARAYRGFYFTLAEWRFAAFRNKDGVVKDRVRRLFEKQLEKQVADPALRARLTPAYPVGCKRILISDNFYPAIQRDNVDLVTDPIRAVTPDGVVTGDGRLRAVDVIILATGFKPFDILETIDITGPGGLSLRERWRHGVAAHKTIAAPGFPNLFMLLGPNSGLGHNSVILMIEAQVEYVLKLIRQASEDGMRLIAPTQPAAAAYDARLQAALKDRVWAADCGAWYVDESGRNYTLYPDDVRTFLKEMRTPDWAEYQIAAPAQTVPG